MLSYGRLSRFVITITCSLALVLGTNITIANATNQSSKDMAAISLEQTAPNKDKAVQTAAEKPKTVTGLVVNVESTSKLNLQWNAVDGASSYKIYRSTKSSDGFKRIGTSTTTSFSNNGLKANASYYYEVSAVNEMGEGNKSSAVFGTTKVPEKVTNLAVTVISDSQLDLSWKAIKGAESYEIYRSGTTSGDYTHIGTSTTNGYSDKDLTANATYYYKVSAVNGIGEGATTSAVLGETKVPGQVTHLRVKVINESRLDLSWVAVSGAESYRIYRSSSSSGVYTFIGTSSTTSYRDKELKESTMYYYRVSAVNSIGEGTKSVTASGRTK